MVETVLYHGSVDRIERPIYGLGKVNNDYGLGFYCTRDWNLAAEWACSKGKDGWVNRYQLDFDGLDVINLDEPPYSILNWLEILIENRGTRITSNIAQSTSWLKKNASIDLSSADVIVGNRADDSFFRYTSRFMDGSISIEDLSKAMHLSGLGIQTVLKSPKAFEALEFKDSDRVLASTYHELYIKRDAEARASFDDILSSEFHRGIRIFDLMSGEVSIDDPRLQ